jgi:hypothetical protein
MVMDEVLNMGNGNEESEDTDNSPENNSGPVGAPDVSTEVSKETTKDKPSKEKKENSIREILKRIGRFEKEYKTDFFSEIKGSVSRCSHGLIYGDDNCPTCMRELKRQLEKQMKEKTKKVL